MGSGLGVLSTVCFGDTMKNVICQGRQASGLDVVLEQSKMISFTSQFHIVECTNNGNQAPVSNTLQWDECQS